MRVCIRCRQEKLESEYHSNGHKGRRATCKECEKSTRRVTGNDPRDGRMGPVDAVRRPDGSIELVRRRGVA